ncbi:MAG: type IV pilus secretin PilQ [candidate division Zixibacteria bacterium]|nr:type IV pilus secretin PilQ [candidate division Zixibacteria bacterium]
MKMILQRKGWLRYCGAILGICIPLAVLISALTGVGKTLAEPSQYEKNDKTITALKLQNADMHSVLSFLADFGDVNIVAAPSVQASVTLTLQDVTWREALDILLKTYRLTGVEEGNFIRVLPTPEFLEEQALLEKRQADQNAMVSLETTVISVRHGTAKDMVKSMKAVISQRGTIDTDDRTNSLVIRDTPEHIEKIKRLVKILDKETDQIRISAQLLEIESGCLTELGINWSMISRKSAQLLEGDKAEADFSQYADRVGGPTAAYTFATVQGDFDIEGVISALVASNKGKIIAHPEITTVDNSEAFIQMGQKIPIKQFDEAGNVLIRFEEVGTILRVTPHITSENRILLKLKPERSSYTFDANGVVINTNNAETNVVVANGQTAVIGGLTTQVEMKVRVGLPILKDLPLLGYLFRYTRTEIANRELMIFVTPTIVTNEMRSMGSSEQPDEDSSLE